MITINIATDFSRTPGGRYISEGNNSGELFLNTVLRPKYLEAKKTGQKLQIIFDGCLGFPSSFIDESFGRLARELKDKKILKDVELISNDQPSLVAYIESRVAAAKE